MQRQCDTEDLRRFANKLRDFCSTMLNEMGSLRVYLAHMAESTWTDDNQQRYEEDFVDVADDIAKALEVFEKEHVHSLKQLADRYDEANY